MKIVIKGFLLWVMIISILLFIMGGCETLIEEGHWIILSVWILLNIGLAFACKKFLTYKDAYKLTGLQSIDNTLK